MHVTVAVDNDDTRVVLESLFDWLWHEDVLRDRVRLRPTIATPESIDTIDDALTVALGAGGIGVVLARSLTEWFKQRTSDVRLTLTRPNRETISLDDRRIRDPAALIDTVPRYVDEHAADSNATS